LAFDTVGSPPRPLNLATLFENGRLPDVVAVITTLDTYKFYKLDASGWADRSSGRQKSAEHWTVVFDWHPEFFRRVAEVRSGART
jgi:hypothetical protein